MCVCVCVCVSERERERESNRERERQREKERESGWTNFEISETDAHIIMNICIMFKMEIDNKIMSVSERGNKTN